MASRVFDPDALARAEGPHAGLAAANGACGRRDLRLISAPALDHRLHGQVLAALARQGFASLHAAISHGTKLPAGRRDQDLAS